MAWVFLGGTVFGYVMCALTFIAYHWLDKKYPRV